MKKTICILMSLIMLISMTACGGKNVSEINNTFSETQSTETQRTEETQAETATIKTDDSSSSAAEDASTTPTSSESGSVYSLVASECYPYNNGMDSPEEVIEAYLDAVINFDADAIYALFNLDEVASSYELFNEELKSYGMTNDMLSSPYFWQAGIYYEMMMDELSADDWLILLQNPAKSYYYNGDITEDYLDDYETYLEEKQLDTIPIEKAYLYDAVGLKDAERDHLYEFIDDDICVICIDGKFYLPFVLVVALIEDSDFLLCADVITDAYEKEQLDFEANAYSPVDTYPSNAGMDSPEEVLNAYINAAKSDNPEEIYALFNTSECKWAAEVLDKAFIEELGVNLPIKLTKTNWLIFAAKSDKLEHYEQTESIEFEEIEEEDNIYEKVVEYYSVPMPFTPQEVKEYGIESDSMTEYLYIYSFNDKWYLSTLNAL